MRIALFPRGRQEWKKAGLRVAICLLVILAIPLVAAWFISSMPGSSFKGALPQPTAEETLFEQNLRRHAYKLAVEIGERNMQRPDKLEEAARYIETVLAGCGYAPQRHSYAVDGAQVSNLEAELAGREPGLGTVVIGAHYDSAWGTPGADDNGSGVAALLELACSVQAAETKRPIRFVAFVNEEPPHFKNESMGSLVYARQCAARGDHIVAMLALEMVGFYVQEEGIQKYPPPLQWFYPDTGDFIGFVGDFGSGDLVRKSIRVFRESTDFPSEGLVGPSLINGVDFSDHWSFWQAGFPAIMITDTAFFRNQHYHQATDTAERLDYARMARVTGGLRRVLLALADE
jgi:hypothetical protein